MARGWTAVEQATQASANARERAQQSSKPQLKTFDVKNGVNVHVRFLEQGQDVNNFPVHPYQVPLPNGKIAYRAFTCLQEINQECPGCKAGMKRQIRGVYNVIWRNRPQIRRDKDGKPVLAGGGPYDYVIEGHRDEVVILNVPSTTAEELRKKDAKYHGLMSRDIELGDSGSTFQPWSVEPADMDAGPQPMSDADVALAQTTRHNLDEFMKPPTIPEAQEIVNKYGGNSGAQQGGGGFQSSGAQGNAAQAPNANNFLQGADPAAVAQATAGGAFGAAQQG